MKEFCEAASVDFSHVGKPLAPLWAMRADERIRVDEVDVVADDDKVAWPESRVYPARGVRQENRSAAHAPHKLYRENDWLPADALVVVPAPAPCRDTLFAAAIKDELAHMPCDCGRAEPRDVGVGRAENHFVHLERLAPAGAEQDSKINLPAEAVVREISSRLVEE